jgi:putative MATE family efflux protein
VEQKQKVTQARKYIQMTTEPVHKLILELAVPTIFSMMVSSFYNVVDTYFVGKLGTSASAAIGINFSFMCIIQAIGFCFGQGSGNYISRELGAKRNENAQVMAAIGYFSAFATGILVMALVFPMARSLAGLLGSTPTILPYASTFLGIICLGAPFMISSLVLNNQLRFQGNAKYGMVGIVSGAVLNIFLEPLFIFTLDLGMAGSAWATVLSQAIGMTVLLIMTYRGGNIPIRWQNFKPAYFFYKEIFLGGIPSLFRQGTESLGILILNLAAAAYGDAAVAAMAIVNRLTFMAAAVMIGFGQGFQPVCGFNFGARLYSRVRQAVFFLLKLLLSYTATIALIGYIWAPELVTVFRDDQEVIKIGTQAMRWQAMGFALSSPTMLCNMTLQTTRQTLGAIIMAMARKGLFLIPYLLILPRYFGLDGVIASQPLSDATGTLVAFAFMTIFLKRLPKQDGLEAVLLK